MAGYDRLLGREAVDEPGHAELAGLHDPIIRQNCRMLKTPAIAAQYQRLAAWRPGRASHIRYLDALLGAEIEERSARRCCGGSRRASATAEDAAGVRLGQAAVSAARVADLASGGYIARAEPVLLIGEAGIRKTHLASGLCVAAREQRRRVRFTTATALVNELVEARAGNVFEPRAGPLGADRADLHRRARLRPSCRDWRRALFQVIADQAERAAVIATSNLPFSEWGQVFPNARLCQALVDRLTDRAHIRDRHRSYRFRRTLAGSRSSV